MMDPPVGVMEIFLQPGEFFFSDKDTRIRTLLGSCVAITVWHPRKLIGGMCHYMVPTRSRPAEDPDELDGKYADEAMTMILNAIRNSRTRPQEYVVKMFGGGSQFPDYTPGQGVGPGGSRGGGPGGGLGLPERNVATGLELLADNGMQLKAQHFGGTGYRHVVLDVWSGDVWLKHGKRTGSDAKPAKEGQPA